MWTAEFVDGPLAETEIEFSFAGGHKAELWFTDRPATGQLWTLVGFAPGFEPEKPWPGQVHYRLDPDASTLERPADWQPGENEGNAVYRLVDDAS